MTAGKYGVGKDEKHIKFEYAMRANYGIKAETLMEKEEGSQFSNIYSNIHLCIEMSLIIKLFKIMWEKVIHFTAQYR